MSMLRQCYVDVGQVYVDAGQVYVDFGKNELKNELSEGDPPTIIHFKAGLCQNHVLSGKNGCI